jgi:hypothetical protein
MLIPLGFWAASGAGGGAGGNAMELISTQVLSTTASTVTFSSIPSTYRHLQLRMTLKDSNAGSTMDRAYYTYNGDTGANYAWHYLSGNGSGVNAGWSNTYDNSIRGVASTLFTASAYSAHVMDILDYAQTTKYKTTRLLGGASNSTYSAYEVALNSGLWMNTAAITSVTIGAQSGQNFLAGCRLSLYGIKG